MSIYSIKQAQTGIVPWADIVPVGKNIKNLYDSAGDVTISSPTQIATLIDGPEKVVRYGNLVLSSTLTATNRCKGLTVICDNLTVQNGGVLSMTGKGARVLTNDDPFFPFTDFLIPDQVTLSSSLISKAQALAIIRAQGIAPWDQGTWQTLVSKLFGFNLAVSQPGQVALLSVLGCGAGQPGRVIGGNGGSAGNAGMNGGTGGGGEGGGWNSNCNASSGATGAGCPYSGGSAGGGVAAYDSWYGVNHADGQASSPYSGPGACGGASYCGAPNRYTGLGSQIGGTQYGGGGGGAGSPGGMPGNQSSCYQGGSGCGGKLVVICFGAVNILSGGKIEANGMPGGVGGPGAGSGYPGGGGSGGGHISIITPSYTTAGTVQAAGGIGGVGSTYGGSGGAGCVVTKTFAQMGTAWQ
ncbi:hypothetical protein [Fundidesulfovibrio terrae]|uniref:hypothetical protein n=1 Tax=Fundidesulfovibrio terrae TaxID=2922866 RepID=UPI001FAFBDDF|nr:hypothetical protein [Fundidesulfovibrio terrae]